PHSPHLVLLPPFPTRRSSDLLFTPISCCLDLVDRDLSFSSFGCWRASLRDCRFADGLRSGRARTQEKTANWKFNKNRDCERCARDRKSTRLNSSHQIISYAVF